MITKEKQPIEELAEKIEEGLNERLDKKSPKMKVSGKKVFDLKRIIENEKNNRHSRTDGQR